MQRKPNTRRRALVAGLLACVLASVGLFAGTANAAATQQVEIGGDPWISYPGGACPRHVEGPSLNVPSSGRSNPWHWSSMPCNNEFRVDVDLTGRAVSSSQVSLTGTVSFWRYQCRSGPLGGCQWSLAPDPEPLDGIVTIGGDAVTVAGFDVLISVPGGRSYEVDGEVWATNFG